MVKEKPLRIQFEMPKDRAVELENLRKLTTIRTRTAVFDVALSLFRWAVLQLQQGRRIVSVDREGVATELVIPGLELAQSILGTLKSVQSVQSKEQATLPIAPKGRRRHRAVPR
jgi:hypothetical protein